MYLINTKHGIKPYSTISAGSANFDTRHIT